MSQTFIHIYLKYSGVLQEMYLYNKYIYMIKLSMDFASFNQ